MLGDRKGAEEILRLNYSKKYNFWKRGGGDIKGEGEIKIRSGGQQAFI